MKDNSTLFDYMIRGMEQQQKLFNSYKVTSTDDKIETALNSLANQEDTRTIAKDHDGYKELARAIVSQEEEEDTPEDCNGYMSLSRGIERVVRRHNASKVKLDL